MSKIMQNLFFSGITAFAFLTFPLSVLAQQPSVTPANKWPEIKMADTMWLRISDGMEMYFSSKKGLTVEGLGEGSWT